MTADFQFYKIVRGQVRWCDVPVGFQGSFPAILHVINAACKAQYSTVKRGGRRLWFGKICTRASYLHV